MKRLMIAALVAGQLMAVAPPAMAAELADGRTQEMGAFGGVRVRVPLDGRGEQRHVRAGLAVAPTLQTRSTNGETRTRIGEGLELGITGRQPPRLMIAGTPVSRLAPGESGPDGRRVGVSTLGWIAIGVGALLVTAVVLSGLCLDGSICDQTED